MTVKLLFAVLMLPAVKLPAQLCTLPGQTPQTAMQVCRNGTYPQPNLAPCRNNSVYVPGCTDQHTNYGDNNPFYYRFTCYSAGSFAFTITPVNNRNDYDWQLFDITGHNPNDIYRDKTLIVTGNWSGSYGATGASATGVSYIQCRSDPFTGDKPTFSALPQLQQGHDYLLMTAHSDELVDGYTLTIGGGTADITSAGSPEIKAAAFTCDNKQVMVTFSKKMLCSSIAADGSDFLLLPAAAAITVVTGLNCTNAFATDSVLVSFSNPLPDGMYELVVKTGTDGNTVMDNCATPLSAGSRLPFKIVSYAAMDSIVPPGCAPGKLTLLFSKNIQCSSVAADGSDFAVTGTGAVSITGAAASCSNTGFTNKIDITLQQPVFTAGNYTITLKNGTDGNSILDACGTMTPPGAAISFSTKDTVTADFTITIKEGCLADTVSFLNEGKNGINSWNWTFDNGSSRLQNPQLLHTEGGVRRVELVVSNGVCSAFAESAYFTRNKLKAVILAPVAACPGEGIIFKDSSSNATAWLWDFDNGSFSTQQYPAPVLYPLTGVEKKYHPRLTVSNTACSATASATITINAGCSIVVPNVFTPNADGRNDYLGPLNTAGAGNLLFTVYNRYGQPVYHSTAGTAKWNGTVNGNRQPAGAYVWILQYTERVTGKTIVSRGSSLLLR